MLSKEKEKSTYAYIIQIVQNRAKLQHPSVGTRRSSKAVTRDETDYVCITKPQNPPFVSNPSLSLCVCPHLTVAQSRDYSLKRARVILLRAVHLHQAGFWLTMTSSRDSWSRKPSSQRYRHVCCY